MGWATSYAVHSLLGCHASRAWPKNLILSYLAGHAGEQVVLGQSTLGAGGGPESDLARATALVYSLQASVGAGAPQPFGY